MAHSFTKTWIHAIWSTKERWPLIRPEIESKIYEYMRAQLEDLACPIRIINGMPDHVHCLFLLNPKKSIAEVIKQVKGSSSHYINQQNLTREKFSWQTGYAAFSVGESGLDAVVAYIRKQKQHHTKTTFREEYARFLALYGFSEERNG